MKQAFAAIVVLGVVIFTLLTIFDLEISITSKKPHPQKIADHPIENKAEKTIDPVGLEKDIIKPSPPPDIAVIAEPPPDKSAPTIAPAEQLTAAAEGPDPGPGEKLPPQPEAATIVLQTVLQPTLPARDKLTQGLGLLTDTGETENNEIIEPRSTQVQPKLPKKALKKPDGPPPVETPVEEAGGQQIAILLEGSYPFSILLETFDQPANAQKAVTIYRNRGIASFWVKVDLGSSGVKYRLFAGTFPSEAAAQAFRARHHLNAQRVKNAPFAACIGVFHDKQSLSTAFVNTAVAGAFPYILGTKGGPFFLYVGAFYTAGGAENQCRELVDKGLPCKAVPRSTLSPKG